ncbi:MAG: hypothetical protein IT458_00680 [Planctomycetes bacterium]|nr:hypothetical protein [Planctomycetota bacterium]
MDAFAFHLLVTAVGLGFLHTVLGPDHYLPFVTLGRARGWTVRRALVVTGLCGLGHVASSLLLGGIGIAIGLGIGHIEGLEERRGDAAAWTFVAIGVAYALWGVRTARRHARGLEVHAHGGHVHLHAGASHGHEHRHIAHPATLVRAPVVRVPRDTTFWALFLVFVLGPCEALIPLFVLPASEGRWGLALATGLVFSATTVATMLAVVGLAVAGTRRLSFGRLEPWSHSLAGGVIAASGLAILFLGL